MDKMQNISLNLMPHEVSKQMQIQELNTTLNNPLIKQKRKHATSRKAHNGKWLFV